jgi:4-amino-4-deoxy-L-arabinose transferase-like glycosyltransferase
MATTSPPLRQETSADPPVEAARSLQPVPPPFFAFIRRHSLAVFFVLVTIGSLRITSTYSVFSHTWDEPNHIAAGTEWLTQGTIRLDYSHPPLARVAAALGPWLASGRPATIPRLNEIPHFWDPATDTGLAILQRGGGYDRNLALARLGILPFFWIASLTVYLWARRYVGEPAAAFSVFFFTFLPPILAHAGLATTDMALTAFVSASFLMALIWTGKPRIPQTLLLGVITGLAVLSKFSALPYLPVALGAAFIWSQCRRTDRLPKVRSYLWPLGLAILTCCLVIWGGYSFSFGVMGAPGFVFPVPAPQLFEGLRNLIAYNAQGHAAFLLGNHSQSGWWYFFLVDLAVKTPLPFLALMFFGAVAATKNKGAGLALAFSLGILLFSLTTHLNLGVRHILPVYVGFSIVAGAGAERMLALSRNAKWPGLILTTLLIWMAGTSALSHPDYLPYFNALAGSKPENVSVDSDVDWGQDVKRLARRLKEVGAQSVAFTPYAPANLKAMGFPPVTPENPGESAPGWNAVSLTMLKLANSAASSPPAANPTAANSKAANPAAPNPAATTTKPAPNAIDSAERIGKGMLLWYSPPK